MMRTPLKSLSLLAMSGLSLSLATLGATPVLAAPGTLPPETPAKFVAPTDAFDFDRRDVMIPMRDGVKLHTVILVPKGAKRAGILLTRTPYNATDMTSHTPSTHMAQVLYGYDNAVDVIVQGGYIRVVQDVRGKYGSEGDYVMNRPMRGPLNPTEVDHATDTYDTIDWLVKNIPETNGKVGILGISYDGFTALTALVNPHPALKVAVPMNPMVDGWMGDDWFHRGAFRQVNISYMYEQVTSRSNEEKWYGSHHDEYEFWLKAGSAANVAKAYGMEQNGFWNKVLAHPAYDGFWQAQAMDKLLAAEPLKVPVMLVHSLFDEEDIYGDMAVYRALKPKDASGDKVFLAIGPWHHGGEIEDGSALGDVKFDQDAALQFRRDVLSPFLAHYLKDEAPPLNTAAVNAFQTGTNHWQKLDRWPVAATGKETSRLYLHADAKLSFSAPVAGEATDDTYVSDPAHPVTYRTGIFRPEYATDSTWYQWLSDDQRFASRRSDVMSYTTDVLTAPVTLAGEPLANIVEATTGTDTDVIVKLIDVYPDEVPEQPVMGGYQLAVSMDILRGRYREGFETAKPVAPGKPLAYAFNLPTVNHVFLPGHRIMVQVQSSWFPLYDRNPQTFTPNILTARPQDYRKATISVFHAPKDASYIDLPLVK